MNLQKMKNKVFLKNFVFVVPKLLFQTKYWIDYRPKRYSYSNHYLENYYAHLYINDYIPRTNKLWKTKRSFF